MWFGKVFLSGDVGLVSRESERQLCGIFSMEAILFQMAGLLIEEINRRTYFHDDVIHQQHFV